MIRAQLTRPWIRAGIGVAISAAFVAATSARVHLELLAEAWAGVSAGLLVIGVVLSFAEVSVRAMRWRLLLRLLKPVGYAVTLGYLSVGHLANALLPARLGDVARALLVGARLRVSRSSVLGTIAVERVSDAGMLGLAVVAGAIIGFRQMASTVVLLFAAGLTVTILAGAAFAVLRHRRVASSRIGKFLRHQAGSFWEGATGLRGWRTVAPWAGLTLASYALTVAIFSTVAAAVGIPLPTWQAALVVASVTLSTAIPAGPASIGTYEFVGLTIMTSIGLPAEQSLVCIVLVHAIVVVPPSLLGLAAMWWLGTRVHAAHVTLGHTATVERARQ